MLSDCSWLSTQFVSAVRSLFRFRVHDHGCENTVWKQKNSCTRSPEQCRLKPLHCIFVLGLAFKSRMILPVARSRTSFGGTAPGLAYSAQLHHSARGQRAVSLASLCAVRTQEFVMSLMFAHVTANDSHAALGPRAGLCGLWATILMISSFRLSKVDRGFWRALSS